MDKNIAISVQGVSKAFKIPHEKISSLRGIIGRKIGKSILKEIVLKNVLTYVKNSINTSFFQVLTGFSEVAIINSLKPPVLTARHGGVLLFKIKI